MIPLRPKSNHYTRSLLEQPALVQQATRLSTGPVHLLFPALMDSNVKRLKETLEPLGLQAGIFYAHKASKSPAFVKQAKYLGIGLDVASYGELISGLSHGFTGREIMCSGPKDRHYILCAIMHGATISLDSLTELKSVADLTRQLSTVSEVPVIIRLANLKAGDRKLIAKNSRFGVPVEDLGELYSLLKSEPRINFLGFHFHNDERPEVKAGYLAHCIDLMEEAYRTGFSPTLINIGGGFRECPLEEPGSWSLFIEKLAQNLSQNLPLPMWRNYALGMYLNDRGTVSGRERAEARVSREVPEQSLTELLTGENISDRPLYNRINDNLFEIALEPGHFLLSGCGVSLLEVTGVKRTPDGQSLVITNGNSFHFLTFRHEIFTDPVLLGNNTQGEPFEGYLAGNLCIEDDLIMTRKVSFPAQPQKGDSIVIFNTAGYHNDFSDSSPLMQAEGVKFVVAEENGKLDLLSEDSYSPFFRQ